MLHLQHPPQPAQTQTQTQTQDPFVVLPSFRADADNPGDVLVIVEDNDFYIHRDLLWFSSSFFRDLLRENWAEGLLADTVTNINAEDTTSLATVDAEPAPNAAHEASNHRPGPEPEPEPVATSFATSNSADRSSPQASESAASRQDEPEPPSINSTEEPGDAPVATEDTSFTLSDAHPSRDNKRMSYHTARITFDDASPTGPSPIDTPSPSPSSAARPGPGPMSSIKTRANSSDPVLLLSPSSRSENLPTRDIDTTLAVSPTLSLQNLQLLETPPGSPRGGMLASLSRSTDGFASGVSPDHDRERSTNNGPSSSSNTTTNASTRAAPVPQVQRHRPISKPRGMIVTVLRLEEEQASTFQSFLCAVYPHLRLAVSWRNIGHLMAFSDKYGVNPALLYDPCRSFLEASLTGNPIEAMRLAEHFGLQGVFKEASKHVLDLYAVWSTTELSVLSKETLIKLERKRSWFLERLLKLSLANPQRDYECQPSCPNQDACAEALQARWTTAYTAAFRFGPPQPTVVWKHLRELEGGGPPLTLSACENACKVWVQTRFDRMFELGMAGPRARSHFLYILLDDSVLVKKAFRRRIRADQLPAAPSAVAAAAAAAAAAGTGGFHNGTAGGSLGVSGSLLDLSTPL